MDGSRSQQVPGLGRTLPADAFSPEGVERSTAATPHPSVPDGPRFDAPGVGDRLRELGLAQAAAGPRFAIEGVLGMGATASVYAVVDRDLDRPVAVKVLGGGHAASADEMSSFLEEARVTASLEHPNVLPVHELDLDADGRLYFTMKRIDGRSLADAIERSSPDERDQAIASPGAVVAIGIAVGHALAYAHARRIVHQDVKPANIMLGGYGEVLLVDWGSAARLGTGTPAKLYGTPLYMSPEQARNESVDERSDVYCLGATLFHALLLRPPMWDDDAQAFWAAKRAGRLDAPEPAERAMVPPALLDIVLKALAAQTADRYPSAEALLSDLRAYQEGLAVSAHREGVISKLRRWHRRHARALWPSLAAMVIVLALLAALWGERLKEFAEWGQPVVDERFDEDGWQSRWSVLEGGFERQAGSLVTTGMNQSTLLLDRKLSGAVAVEYEARLVPGSRPCDLSLTWARDLERGEDGTPKLVGTYMIQFGVLDGAYTAIRLANGQHLACSDAYPRPGVLHRVRFEVEDERLSLWIDGRLECEWLDPVRFTGGYVALYGFYPGKAFGRVRVYERGVPQRVPVTAIGDTYLRDGDLVRAEREFARVVASHRDSDVGREAIYKQGLCAWNAGRPDGAEKVWTALAGSDREELVRLHRIERRFADDDRDGALAAIEELAPVATERGRRLLAMRWGQCVDQLRGRGKTPEIQGEIERWLRVYERWLSDEKVANASAADSYLHVRRYEEVLERFPRQRLSHCFALEGLGRIKEVADHYEDQMRKCARARHAIGESARIDPIWVPGLYAAGLIERGRFEELLTRFPTDPSLEELRCHARLLLGRLDELRVHPDPSVRARAHLYAGDPVASLRENPAYVPALLAVGNVDEVLRRHPASIHHHGRARHLLALQALERGDRAAAEAQLAHCSSGSDGDPNVHRQHHLLLPFALSAAAGDWRAFDGALERCRGTDRWHLEQKPWHDARWLLGEMSDEDFRAQPHNAFAAADLLVLRSMRDERAGRGTDALAGYRAWLATPTWKRAFDYDVVGERFVQWRAEQLSGR